MNNIIIQGNQNATKLINLLKKQGDKYKPLEKDQERDLIEKYKNDRETLNNLLFMHNVKFVFKMAKKYMSKTRDFDNLVQQGMKGLAIATQRFDVEKGSKFITYAGWWIRKFMLQLFDKKKNWIDNHSISLNSLAMQSSSKQENSSQTYENFVNEYIEPTQDISKSTSAVLSSIEQNELCNNLMKDLENDKSLSATERAVFTDFFYNKEKMRDIAAKYGIELQRAMEIKKNILNKLKETLASQYQITSYDDVR